jgi:crotonobetainyl-CoA:carnitine CoA-transferase CaiB-like acyl-CoA transferase
MQSRTGQGGPAAKSGRQGSCALPYEELVLNRNKKSMTLDLRAAAGRDILCRLAERNDVEIESYRPGVTRRLGIEYDTLKRSNSRLVYCSL